MKNWIKKKNREGKLLLVRKILEKGYQVATYPSRIYQLYPREALANSIKGFIKSSSGTWTKFSFDRGIKQSIFHVYQDESGSEKLVIKLPKGGNPHGAKFIRELRQQEALERYFQALKHASSNSLLRAHSPELIQISSRGGYVSEYIDGFNLAHLRDTLFAESSMPIEYRKSLCASLTSLLQHLRDYQKQYQHLTGDWALHNLLYSPSKKAIINVDLEGYYSYSKPSVENNLTWIEGNLTDMVTYLVLLESCRKDDIRKISTLNVLDEVRKSGESYSGSSFLVGYHSMTLDGKLFRGQRECIQRLSSIPYDFEGKVVVDLGCNSGGMLHALSGKIDHGYGFDFNPKCINAAQAVKALNSVTNLEFYNFDLDRDDLATIPNLMLKKEADICFLLSVCMWLINWKDVVSLAVSLSDTLLFESNGSAEQQDEQVALLHHHYGSVVLLDKSSKDDFFQSSRRLYLCSNAKTVGKTT